MARAPKPKRDYVQEVADRVIEQIEAGTAPWQKPWEPGSRFAPYNSTTGKDYRGLNSMWLMMQGREDPRWMTYRQAEAAGAQVQKGSSGTLIQYWMWEDQRKVVDDAGRPVVDGEGKQLTQRVRLERPRVMSAVVFNAEQIDGLPELEVRAALPEVERHERAEAMMEASPASIRHVDGDRAYYHLGADQITLPLRDQFKSLDGYYATALHEIGHSTGHKDRLDRDLSHPFGSEGYAREELRAEIASLMLGERLGIGHDPGQHASYAASWIKVLQNDPREIFRAAADAEKIMNFMLTLEQQNEKTLQQSAGEERDGLAPELTGREDGRARELDGPSRNDLAAAIPETPEVTERETPMHTSEQRVNLAVPYAEKDAAKAAGARWDKALKMWYAPPGADLNGLNRWRPSNEAALPANRDRKELPEVEFKRALLAAGLVIPDKELPFMDGQLHRVPVEGDKAGQRSGAYKGFTDGHPAGFIQNHLQGTKENWKSEQVVQSLSAEDRARAIADSEERRAQRAADEQRRYERASVAMTGLVSSSPAAPGDHPYLIAKGVQPHGLKMMAEGGFPMPPGDPKPMAFGQTGDLLVPYHDADGKVWGAQSVSSSGRKSFPRGARLAGCFHMIGDAENSPQILVAEGYATAATLHQATGLPVAVAFHSNNLRPVAEALQSRHPEAALVIAGDNDHRKEAEGKKNVGREKAEEAAQAVGGRVILPAFGPDDRGTDWNDLAAVRGETGVRQEVSKALAIAERKSLADEIRRDRDQSESRGLEAATNHLEREPQYQERAPREKVAALGR